MSWIIFGIVVTIKKNHIISHDMLVSHMNMSSINIIMSASDIHFVVDFGVSP